jgi:hypothetical protein
MMKNLRKLMLESLGAILYGLLLVLLVLLVVGSISQSKQREDVKNQINALKQAGEYDKGGEKTVIDYSGEFIFHQLPHFKAVSRLEDRIRTLEKYLNVSYVPGRERIEYRDAHYKPSDNVLIFNVSSIDSLEIF